jgi:adenylylsulfate kinase
VQKGVTIWFTGLSGSGKSTISGIVENKLKERNIQYEVLDGDVVRQHLTSDLGFSKEDREKNIERVSFVAKILAKHNIVVLASFISPYQKMRNYCRNEIESFAEVYVKCPIDECIRRDVKGLYKKALKGDIKEFTGISDPFEEPVNPDLTLETNKEEAEVSAAKVLLFLEEKGYIEKS